MNENNNGGAGDGGAAETTVDVSTLTAEQIAEVEKAEKFILDFKDEDYDDPEKMDALKEAHKQAKTTIHQKRHFREKVTSLEADLKKYKPAEGEGDKKGKEGAAAAAADTTKTGVDPVQVVNFKVDNPTLSKATVAEIQRIAGAFSISMEEAAGTETGKAVIKSLENKESNADATPAPSKKAGAGLDKRDWSNASPAEMDAERNKILRGE